MLFNFAALDAKTSPPNRLARQRSRSYVEDLLPALQTTLAARPISISSGKSSKTPWMSGPYP